MIVATAQHGGIGRNNKIPWYNKEDLQFFKETTTGHAVLMGNKTFQSIGKPLPNRTNIVVSRSFDDFNQEGNLIKMNDLDDALAYAKKTFDFTFIIGGAEIYESCFSIADYVLISEMPYKGSCDKFFPRIGLFSFWKFLGYEERETFKLKIYRRKNFNETIS